MQVIKANNLSFAYQNKKVLNQLNFSLNQGRVLGLLGPNGAGKSTLINLLNGFLNVTEGTISIYDEPAGKLSRNSKTKIAYLMEGHVQYGFMNVGQLEKFYSGIYSNWNYELYSKIIANSQISRKQSINSMSRGERSRVALAVCLAQTAELLVMDDFSMCLDPIYRKAFIYILKEYKTNNNTSMLLTSHIVQDLDSIIDDVMILGYGFYMDPQPVNEFLSSNKTHGNTLEEIFINLINQKKC